MQGALGAQRVMVCPLEIHGLLSPDFALAHGSGGSELSASQGLGDEGQEEMDTAMSQPQQNHSRADAHLRSHGLLEPKRAEREQVIPSGDR